MQPKRHTSVNSSMGTSTSATRTPVSVAVRPSRLRMPFSTTLARYLTGTGWQIVALTLLALLLRRYHLGDESLWFDEADIVMRAGQPVPELLKGFTQAGENGPLYTLMLHFWLGLIEAVPPLQKILHLLFGASYEGPVRGLSMLFGAAAVPLLYVLGRKVGGHRLGIVSAVLLAINPFHIWYSQDAKMYSLLVLLTMATTLLYIEAWERNRTALWAAYVVCTWVMLTTHSMAGLVLLAHIAAAPFMARRVNELRIGDPPILPEVASEEAEAHQSTIHNPQSTIGWGWAMLLILAPLFPIAWLRLAALLTDTGDFGGWYSPASLPDILGTIGVTFAVNRAPAPWEAVGALALAGLATVGILSSFGRLTARHGSHRPVLSLRRNTDHRPPTTDHYAYVPLVLALVILPLSVFWLVTLKIPLFQARYLIMALPPYVLLASVGLLALRQAHPLSTLVAGLTACLLGISTFSALAGVNYSPQVQKEDWRGAMVYVQDHLRLRDEIVIFPGYLASAVEVYYAPGGSGAVPVVPIKAVPSLGVKNFGERELEDKLRQVVKDRERAWFVISPIRAGQEDPGNQVEEWFTGNWHLFDRKEFNGVTVFGISFNGQPDSWYPNPTSVEPHAFDNGLSFLGYIYELREGPSIQPGTQPDASYFPLTLYWRDDRKLLVDYTIRIRIKDKAGKTVVDEALGPLSGYWPTTQWRPNSQIIDYRDLRLPGGLTPGDYTVSLELYPRGDPTQPLKTVEGTGEILLKEPLKIVPWKP